MDALQRKSRATRHLIARSRGSHLPWHALRLWDSTARLFSTRGTAQQRLFPGSICDRSNASPSAASRVAAVYRRQISRQIGLRFRCAACFAIARWVTRLGSSGQTAARETQALLDRSVRAA